VNKEFVGGCDILVAMHQSGELAELLEKEGVLVPAEETKKPEETKPEA
jgi:monothiol glutaredoxin